jgi:hypothetical protein
MPLVDMRQFDSLSQNLQLSEGQRSAIAKAKADTARKSESFRNEYDRAKADLDRCSGKCEKEQRRVDDAAARWREFQNREFAQRLDGILTDQQKRSMSDRDAR